MTKRPLRIAIIGTGLMGEAVRALATERGIEVVASLDKDAMTGGSDDLRKTLESVDVALEFTTPSAAVDNIRVCLDASCPVVVGSTGWYDDLAAVKDDVAACGGSLLWAPNFSIGIALLTELVRKAGRLASGVEHFDVHMLETHHRMKRDAPSGTALSLKRALSSELGRTVPITSVRTGSVPGTHEVTLDGPFERITLRHEARDRRVFADGALTAAAWLPGRTGVFTMDDVLGVNDS